jgi:hypothetical protein
MSIGDEDRPGRRDRIAVLALVSVRLDPASIQSTVAGRNVE